MTKQSINVLIGVVLGLALAYLLSAFVMWDFFWMPDAHPDNRARFVFIALLFMFLGAIGGACND